MNYFWKVLAIPIHNWVFIYFITYKKNLILKLILKMQKKCKYLFKMQVIIR